MIFSRTGRIDPNVPESFSIKICPKSQDVFRKPLKKLLVTALLCTDPGVNGSNQPTSNFNFVVELVTQNAGAVLQYVEVPILVHQSWTQIAGC